MPTETTIMERIAHQELAHARIDERVKTIEIGYRDIWVTLGEMRQMVWGVRLQVAAIVAVGGLAQAIFTAYLVYKITKG